MAIEIIVTTAGRAALVNAVNTGTNAVTITQLGITAAVFVPNAGQVALPGEIKRIASVAGVVVADDQIHVTASDVTTDAYTMRGFALYLGDGTLFAVYGQAGAILNKTAESMMLLAADIAFADIDAELIEFGDTNFVLPPATTEILGLVELATTPEAQTGSDATRVLTPLTGKQSVLGWLLSQDGSGSGLDADLLDGLHASAFSLTGHNHNISALFGYGTMASQNAGAVAITGGAIDGTTLGVTTPAAAKVTTLQTTGALGVRVAAPATTVEIGGAGTNRLTITSDLVGSAYSSSVDFRRAGVAGGARIETVRNIATGGVGLAIQVTANNAAEVAGTLTTALTISEVGAVGIGCTPLANTPLQVKVAADRRFSAFANGAENVLGFLTDAGNWTHTMLSGSTVRFAIGGAEKVRISAAGTLCIGSQAEAYAETLSVVKDHNGTTYSLVRNADQGVGAFGAYALNCYGNSWGMGMGSAAANANALTFSSDFLGARNPVMTLLTGGNVGIGTTAPGSKLTVAGAGGTATINLLESGVRSWAIRAGGAATNIFDIADLTAGATRFSINQNGAIVINGANPNYVFNVGASNPTRGIIADIANWAGAGLNGALLSFTQNGINNWCVGQTPGVDAFSIYRGRNGATDGTEIMRLTAAGATILGNTVWHAGNDGAGSGLDADLLDGQQGSYYLPAASYTAADVLAKLLGVDGTGSGLDADTVDGLHAAALVKYTDFTGSNQSFGSSGYQKLPGGLIIQWGTYFVSANASTSVSTPIAFPNACLFATTSGGRLSAGAQDNNPFVSGFSQFGVTIYSSSSASVSGGWIAIGY